MLDRKMDDTFMMGTTSSITMQNLGKAVGAKMWCFFCHAPSPERRAFEGCVAVYRSISTRFAAFFSEGIALSDDLHSSDICR